MGGRSFLVSPVDTLTYLFRKTAASILSASLETGSVTVECRITSESGSRGSPYRRPTSRVPTGATLYAKGATAKPAETAAPMAVIPPPIKTSLQGIPALSSNLVASVRTPQDFAIDASRRGCPEIISQSGEANHPNRSWTNSSPSRRSSSLLTITASTGGTAQDTAPSGNSNATLCCQFLLQLLRIRSGYPH